MIIAVRNLRKEGAWLGILREIFVAQTTRRCILRNTRKNGAGRENSMKTLFMGWGFS